MSKTSLRNFQDSLIYLSGFSAALKNEKQAEALDDEIGKLWNIHENLRIQIDTLEANIREIQRQNYAEAVAAMAVDCDDDRDDGDYSPKTEDEIMREVDGRG